MRVVTELLRWCLGAALLLIIDVFAEAVVFEWLQWNGTTQNDWFFLLWWLMVADGGGMDSVLSPPRLAGDVEQAGLEQLVLPTKPSVTVYSAAGLQWPCIQRNQ
jgi:hypothetical protein